MSKCYYREDGSLVFETDNPSDVMPEPTNQPPVQAVKDANPYPVQEMN